LRTHHPLQALPFLSFAVLHRQQLLSLLSLASSEIQNHYRSKNSILNLFSILLKSQALLFEAQSEDYRDNLSGQSAGSVLALSF